MAALHGVALAPLGLGLDNRIVAPLAEAFLVVASVPVRCDVGVGRHLAVSEALHGVLVIVFDVGEAHSSVCLGGHQNQLLVRSALSPDERLVDLHERAERIAV